MTGLPEALTHSIHLRLLRLLAAHRFSLDRKSVV